MACFIVPSTLAVLTTGFRKKFPTNWHINWLNTMIWGGAIGLAVEHIAHQEIVPWFPFFTAMRSPADTAAMFKEMAAVGIPMTVALVAAWIVMVVVYEKFIVPHKAPVKRLNLGMLTLMLLGTLIMVLVDHLVAYINGGKFFEATTSGLISSSLLLGIAMIAPILIIWMIASFIQSKAEN